MWALLLIVSVAYSQSPTMSAPDDYEYYVPCHQGGKAIVNDKRDEIMEVYFHFAKIGADLTTGLPAAHLLDYTRGVLDGSSFPADVDDCTDQFVEFLTTKFASHDDVEQAKSEVLATVLDQDSKDFLYGVQHWRDQLKISEHSNPVSKKSTLVNLMFNARMCAMGMYNRASTTFSGAWRPWHSEFALGVASQCLAQYTSATVMLLYTTKECQKTDVSDPNAIYLDSECGSALEPNHYLSGILTQLIDDLTSWADDHDKVSEKLFHARANTNSLEVRSLIMRNGVVPHEYSWYQPIGCEYTDSKFSAGQTRYAIFDYSLEWSCGPNKAYEVCGPWDDESIEDSNMKLWENYGTDVLCTTKTNDYHPIYNGLQFRGTSDGYGIDGLYNGHCESSRYFGYKAPGGVPEGFFEFNPNLHRISTYNRFLNVYDADVERECSSQYNTMYEIRTKELEERAQYIFGNMTDLRNMNFKAKNALNETEDLIYMLEIERYKLQQDTCLSYTCPEGYRNHIENSCTHPFNAVNGQLLCTFADCCRPASEQCSNCNEPDWEDLFGDKRLTVPAMPEATPEPLTTTKEPTSSPTAKPFCLASESTLMLEDEMEVSITRLQELQSDGQIQRVTVYDFLDGELTTDLALGDVIDDGVLHLMQTIRTESGKEITATPGHLFYGEQDCCDYENMTPISDIDVGSLLWVVGDDGNLVREAVVYKDPEVWKTDYASVNAFDRIYAEELEDGRCRWRQKGALVVEGILTTAHAIDDTFDPLLSMKDHLLMIDAVVDEFLLGVEQVGVAVITSDDETGAFAKMWHDLTQELVYCFNHGCDDEDIDEFFSHYASNVENMVDLAVLVHEGSLMGLTQQLVGLGGTVNKGHFFNNLLNQFEEMKEGTLCTKRTLGTSAQMAMTLVSTFQSTFQSYLNR